MIAVQVAINDLALIASKYAQQIFEMMVCFAEKLSMEEEQGTLGNFKMVLVIVECFKDVKLTMEKENAKNMGNILSKM
jgi:hypothetical protein